MPGTGGERCSKITKNLNDENGNRKTWRSIIYAFTLTMAICLLAIGIYYTLQRGCLRNVKILDRFKSGTGHSPSSGSQSFFRTNFTFNKLEDEQVITQNEHVTDTV